MMIANQLSLTSKQVHSFDRVLMDGTGKALSVLETMFGLDIESSDSSIEISSAIQSENLKHLGNEALYTVSSAMVGDMQGSVLLLMRSSDFNHLGKAMRPVLSLLFLSSTDVDLKLLDSQQPAWMNSNNVMLAEDTDYHAQMMDMLSEMANIFIGLYAKAIYRISDLNTHYSVPEALKDPGQQAIQKILSSSEASEQLHLVIQNEFFVMDKPIKLWCLISPTEESFQDILNRIERREEYH